jgi:protein-disulfide isomerase
VSAPAFFRKTHETNGQIIHEHGAVLPLSQRSQPAQPANVAAKVSVGDGPRLGKNDAPVTLAEFPYYQCPFCGWFFKSTFATLKKDYIDTGKVRYVFRDFPLDTIHKQARKATEAVHCAGA